MISELIFNRKRSEEEYKIVLQVIIRCDLRSYPYVSSKEVEAIGDKRAYDYNDLKKLPDLLWSLKEENSKLKREIQSYKEQAETVSSVIDTILDTVEKRYDMSKGE